MSIPGSKSSMTTHQLFHILWSKAIGTTGYNKDEWHELSTRIYGKITIKQSLPLWLKLLITLAFVMIVAVIIAIIHLFSITSHV